MPAEKTKKSAVKKTDKNILVIVESPAKAKTINKYLGKEYKVTASMGHIIDLPKSRMGVNIENDFEPEYITVRGKGKVLTELKKIAANSKSILLASDNDREGEAIAYHIADALKKKYPELPIQRIVFNEITKNAIVDSIKSPHDIDINKVEAQKTRRILDRLVGYKISPILWEKVKNGLSAGRVQSLTLKAICEREDEIEKFVPEEYWSVNALLNKDKKDFEVELSKIGEEKADVKSSSEVDIIKSDLKNGEFVVSNIQINKKSMSPQPPFITSKLQQAAANRFGFTSRKTMSVAQQLYEGIDIGKDTVGLITYMRTDSVRISDIALSEVRDYIKNEWPDFLPEQPVVYSKKTGAQDAHEAIRPTSTVRTPELLKKHLTPDQYKLYGIIWERFVASQMKNAEYSNKSISISSGKYLFKVSKSDMISKGYNACLNLLKSKDTVKAVKLPEIAEGDVLNFKELITEQHFTQPPARYSDASIIKFLEENGVGRPSTYAPIISTLLDRYYVVRKAKQIEPTVLGKLVNDIIVKSFPDIVNIDFTAKLEGELDEIANGNAERIKLLKDFYEPFEKHIEEAVQNLEVHKKVFDEETDEVCEKCGSKMLKKLGRYGFFLACSNFPECRNAKTIPLADCPVDGCGGKIIARKKGPRGKEFYGCTNYPECQFVTWNKPTELSCPKCGKFLVEKKDKEHGYFRECVDEKCGYKQVEEHSVNE